MIKARKHLGAKALFITPYLLFQAVLLGAGILGIFGPGRSLAWGGLIPGSISMLWLSMGNLALNHHATTRRWLPLPTGLHILGLALVLGAGAWGGGGGRPWPLILGTVQVLAYGVYLVWYSGYAPVEEARAREVGEPLPDFPAVDLEGKPLSSRSTLGRPTVFIFYRGNWCPFCVTQVKNLAEHWKEYERRGIEVVLISPQPAEHSRDLATRFGIPARFWVDQDLRAAKILGIVDQGGLPVAMDFLGYEEDTVRPLVILTDQEGVIRYSDLASSYRVRPEDGDILKAFDDLIPV